MKARTIKGACFECSAAVTAPADALEPECLDCGECAIRHCDDCANPLPLGDHGENCAECAGDYAASNARARAAGHADARGDHQHDSRRDNALTGDLR